MFFFIYIYISLCCLQTKMGFIVRMVRRHHRREEERPVGLFLDFCQIVLIYQLLLSNILSFIRFPRGEFSPLLLSEDWTRFYHFKFDFSFLNHISPFVMRFSVFLLLFYFVLFFLEERKKKSRVFIVCETVRIGRACDCCCTFILPAVSLRRSLI